MAWRSILVLLLLAGATGCWTESCATGWECTERLSGVFDPGPGSSEALVWCRGTTVAGQSCRDLGYTVECGGAWYRPETAAYVCR